MHQRLAGAGSGTESGYRAARRLDFCLRLCYTMVVLDVPHRFAIVAQLDRAFGSDPEGQRFESSRSHVLIKSPVHKSAPGIFLCGREGQTLL